MKIGKKLRRICAAAVAAAIGLTSWQTFLPELVEAAAGQYYVQFVNLENNQFVQETTIVAGESIQTVGIIPPNHEYTSPPFRITNAVYGNGDPLFPSSGNPMPSDFFNTVLETNDVNTSAGIRIRAKDEDATDYAKEKVTYNFIPAFNAHFYEATSVVITGRYKNPKYDPNDTSPNAEKEYIESILGSTATVTGTPVSIIEASKLVLKLNNSQTLLDDGSWITDGTITLEDATGDLASYLDHSVVTITNGNDPQKLSVEIVYTGSESRNEIALDIVMPNRYPYEADTEIEINFTPASLRALRLTVLPRQTAVNQIADDIQAQFKNYIRYTKAEDTKDNVTTNFYLKQKLLRYNFDSFSIDWEWTQKNTEISPCVVIQKGATSDEEVLARIERPLDDEQGTLTATVIYKATVGGKIVKSTQKVSIDMTIRGRGIMPSVEANQKFTGYYDEVENRRRDKVEELVYTNFPDMDVYDGRVKGWRATEEEIAARDPYIVSGFLNFGTGVSTATFARIEVDNPEFVDVFLDTAPTSVYVPGTDIPNQNMTGPEYREGFQIKAKKAGHISLRITFYNDSGTQFGPIVNRPITIVDTSPSDDARLDPIVIYPFLSEEAKKESAENQERFDLVYPNGRDDYGFEKETFDYTLTMPWVVDKIKLTANYYHPSAFNSDISVACDDGYYKKSWKLSNDKLTDSGMEWPEIPLTIGKPMKISVSGTAEDMSTSLTYNYTITRLSKSENAFLDTLNVVTHDKVEQITEPDLEMKFSYDVSLPYSYHDKPIEITALTQDNWAKKPTFTVDPADAESKTFLARVKKLINSGKTTVIPRYDWNKETGVIKNVTRVYIDIESESGIKVRYTVNITIEDPSTDNDLIQLDVYRQETGEPLSFDNKVVFSKEGIDYYLTIPYSTQKLRFEMLPNDEKATDVRLRYPKAYRDKECDSEGWKKWMYTKKGTPISPVVGVAADDPITEDQKKFDFSFDVLAESEDWRSFPYVIHVERADPDINARLASMAVTDADTDAPVESFSFNPQKLEYDFTVPFTTAAVVVSPVAQSELSKVMVDDAGISETYPGRAINLKEGVVTTVNVKVTPEGGTKYEQTYVLRIRRELPSTDARLQSLVVNGGENMTPVPFLPSHTTYNVVIPEGTKGYTITAVPVEPHATITIDGKAVENGQPSQTIVSTEGNSRIKIVVTAQDGRTTKTYTLNVRDYNLIKKSSDATLSALGVNYADMAPSFRPNREDYELYVKPDAMGIDLTPELSDSRSTMKVYSGSRQMTAYDGVYSGSLIEEENVFTIDVTAEDGTTTKSYTLTVYKNDEEKQGHMRPVTADVVDFSENPIVIDITNYSVIDASVFNTLKVDYPDKTIIFQGNDYTLQMRGRDIAGLVPYNTTYDLKLLFTTPEENLIRDALWDLNADPRQYMEDLEPVFLYFDDHTALPGKMLLTVHLGRAYSNDQLFWNYYNSERDRLDYYGYVRSNAQGSFSVAINHFSTYIITKERIIGAESKVGLTYGGASTTSPGAADGSAGGDPGKNNPQTGVNE